MVEIMVEMFMFEQTVRDHREFSPIADTTLVYAAILRKHGYSVKEYNRSLAYHLQKPDKLKKAMISHRDQMMKRKNALQEEVDKALRMAEVEKAYRPRFTYMLPSAPPFSLVIDSVQLQSPDSLRSRFTPPPPDSSFLLPKVLKPKI
jgi:DNA-binding transcriptional MerR regulator